MEETAGGRPAARAPSHPWARSTQQGRAGAPGDLGTPGQSPEQSPVRTPLARRWGAAPIRCLGGAGVQVLPPGSLPPFLWGAGATFSLSAPSPSWPSAPQVWPGHQPHLCLFLSWEPREAEPWAGVTQHGSERPSLHLLGSSPPWTPAWVGGLAEQRCAPVSQSSPPAAGDAGPPPREVLTGEWLSEGLGRRCLLHHGCGLLSSAEEGVKSGMKGFGIQGYPSHNLEY